MALDHMCRCILLYNVVVVMIPILVKNRTEQHSVVDVVVVTPE